jgi:prephenate dehydrogenase
MGQALKIAIIGGAGKMGQWFARLLLDEGVEVAISDNRCEELREGKIVLAGELMTTAMAISRADAVIISVPIDNFEEVIKEIACHVQPGQAVIDISSIKVRPMELMHKYIAKGLVLGVHPMFGPGAVDIVNKNFVLTPTNSKEKDLAKRIEIQLNKKGANVSQMAPDEHDELMAIILGLPSFIAIVSADTLLSLNRLQKTRNISGSTYKLLLMLTESVVTKDANLYASLQMTLPNIAEIENLFLSKAETWVDMVKNKDKQKLIEKLHSLESDFKKENPNFTGAYENMYKLIEAL